MKCGVHPKRDAIAICRSCGIGLCKDCRITLAGLNYCNNCLQAGHYRPPSVAPGSALDTPLPRPGFPTPLTRPLFLLGIFGMILIGISFHILWIYPYFWVYYAPLFDVGDPLRLFGYILLTIGIIFSGFAFYGFGSYYNSKFGKITGFFSFFSSWWLLGADLILFTDLVYLISGYPYLQGPLFMLYAILNFIGLVFLAVMLILWATSLVQIRQFTRSKILIVSASLLFVIQAHVIIFQVIFMASYIFSPLLVYTFLQFQPSNFLSAGLLEGAGILCAIVFFREWNALKPSPGTFFTRSGAVAQPLDLPSSDESD